MTSSKDKLGALGEARTIAELIRNDYTVFTQFDGKAPFDLVAYKDDKLFRVSVKSTANLKNNKYSVKINATRHNGIKNWSIPFDNTSVDILAVYLEQEDKVILFPAETITSTSRLIIHASVS